MCIGEGKFCAKEAGGKFCTGGAGGEFSTSETPGCMVEVGGLDWTEGEIPEIGTVGEVEDGRLIQFWIEFSFSVTEV